MTTPDLDAPEFAPIRRELAQLFVAHKADMGFVVESDDYIAAHVDLITIALIQLTMQAHERGDDVWLARHQSWREAMVRLAEGS